MRLDPRLLKPVVVVLSLIPLAWLARRALIGDLGANPIEEVEIQTGLWTLRFLAITLAVTPLRQLTGRNELIRYRRMLGLFTFFYACVHLSAYVGLDMFFDWGDMVEDIAEHLYITVGMATFLLLLPLAITSTTGWVRRLGGHRWRKLHRLVYLAAVGGTVHFLWAVKKDITEPIVYAIIFATLFAIRVVMAMRRRKADGRATAAAMSARPAA